MSVAYLKDPSKNKEHQAKQGNCISRKTEWNSNWGKVQL